MEHYLLRLEPEQAWELLRKLKQIREPWAVEVVKQLVKVLNEQ